VRAGEADCRRCQVAKPASWLWLDVGRKSSRRRARAATAQRGAGGRARVATMTAAQVGWCAGDGCTHDDCLPFLFDLSFPSFLILSLEIFTDGGRATTRTPHASPFPPSFFNSVNAPRRFLLPFNSDDARPSVSSFLF
jgi:hypothetical protein